MTTPEELQQLSDYAQGAGIKNNDTLKQIEITKDMEDAFLRCVEGNTPFSFKFDYKKGDDVILSVMIREKTVKENEIVLRAAEKVSKSENFVNWVEYARVYNNLCLYYQVVSINNVPLLKEYPNGTFDKKFDLYSIAEKSSIFAMPSYQHSIVTAFTYQFEDLCKRLASTIIDDVSFFL